MKPKGTLIAGGASLILLILLLILARFRDSQADPASLRDASLAEDQSSLVFLSGELRYDGRGRLDLMEGVSASDENGDDITGRVSAVITGDGTKNRKKVRYSVFTSSGRQLTEERSLILENYQGPQITVTDHITIDAESLPELTQTLSSQGLLRGEDGFGQDITGQITWMRRKISDGLYRITFELDNAWLDHASAETEAVITGSVRDLELTLSTSETEISAGSGFHPLDYLERAEDPDYGDISDQVEVSGIPDTDTPGVYSLVYTAVSVDGTQKAEAVLTVTVRER